MLRVSALALLCTMMMGCRESDDPYEWLVKLDEMGDVEVSMVEVALLRGGCEGERFYSARLTRDMPSGMAAPAGLESGQYAITARVMGVDCEWAGFACALYDLPADRGPVYLYPEPYPEGDERRTSACNAAEACEGGACQNQWVECDGNNDGAVCGPSELVCIDGTCRGSSCGDGFVSGDEDCDDGNDIDGDGCDACAFSCTSDDDCDDNNPCNGMESCSDENRCEAGDPPVIGGSCGDPADGRVCRGTPPDEVLCVSADCGNCVLDMGEECDPGGAGCEATGDAGCRTDCRFACTIDEDCNDGDPCTGIETCDRMTNVCVEGTAPDCDDDEPCTVDSCDPEWVRPIGEPFDPCVNDFDDQDLDGVAGPACARADLMGGDCNDDDSEVYPGAVDACGGTDSDCDGEIDEDADAVVTCYPDADGDGFGAPTGGEVDCSCSIPAREGWVASNTDCEDVAALGGVSVNPGVTSYFTTPYGPDDNPSFDYDCDGAESPRFRYVADCSCGVFRSGWQDRPPRCGTGGVWRQCVTEVGLMKTSGCTSTASTRMQECR